MGVTQDLADALARDAIAAGDEMGDERFYEEVAKAVAVLSPTMQEAFMTSIRVRLAERRGRALLIKRLETFRQERMKADVPQSQARPDEPRQHPPQ